MLNIALDELATRGAQQLRSRQIGSRGQQRRDILQLVAKAVGAARLVEGRSRPDAAGQRLIEQPAVEHDVERAIGRPHLNHAQHRLPVALHIIEHGVEIGNAVTLD